MKRIILIILIFTLTGTDSISQVIGGGVTDSRRRMALSTSTLQTTTVDDVYTSFLVPAIDLVQGGVVYKLHSGTLQHSNPYIVVVYSCKKSPEIRITKSLYVPDDTVFNHIGTLTYSFTAVNDTVRSFSTTRIKHVVADTVDGKVLRNKVDMRIRNDGGIVIRYYHKSRETNGWIEDSKAVYKSTKTLWANSVFNDDCRECGGITNKPPLLSQPFRAAPMAPDILRRTKTELPSRSVLKTNETDLENFPSIIVDNVVER